MDFLPAEILPAGRGSQLPVPAEVARPSGRGWGPGQAPLPGIFNHPRRSHPLGGLAAATAQEVGGLRQTSLWREGAGLEVSRPLHPPCRDLQRPTGQSHRRSCQLSLARLQGWQTPEGDESRGGGIHPPLPSPYLAFRLRQNPPLRLPSQPQPLESPGSLPPTLALQRSRPPPP